MLLILLICALFAWLMFKLMGLVFSATFGVMSIIGVLLLILAAPILITTVVVAGISFMLVVPFLLLGAAGWLLSLA